MLFQSYAHSATLYDLHNHNYYRFEIWAITQGGEGEKAVITKYIGKQTLALAIYDIPHMLTRVFLSHYNIAINH